MMTWRAVWRRLIMSVRPGHENQALHDEWALHRDFEIDANLRAGMSPADAQRAADLKLGPLASAREVCHDTLAFPALAGLVRDVYHAVRLLARQPLFTVVAATSLAVGMGANTAIFALLDQISLRPLPVRAPHELEMIWTSGPHLGTNQGERAVSYPMYQDFQQHAAGFSHIFCRAVAPVSLRVGNEAERVISEMVSGNFFQALGVGAAYGRVFSPDADDRVYLGHPVVVLSYPYWVSRFGANPAVIGTTIRINNYPMTIVGVSAEGFTGIDPTRSPQVRIPIQMKPIITPGSDQLANRRIQWLQVFGRRKPHLRQADADATLQTVLRETLRDEIQSPALRTKSAESRQRFLARTIRTQAIPSGHSSIPRTYTQALMALMGMVSLILLLTCFNIAGLLLARGAARTKEFATRLALGASRGQLLRQLGIESLVLSMMGGAGALIVSTLAVRGLLGYLPDRGMVATLDAVPDWRILAFNTALVFVAVVLFGLAPARQALSIDLTRAINEGRGAAGGSGRVFGLRRHLVTAQVTLSYVLVVSALLFVKTSGNLQQATSGFHAIDTVVTFQVDPSRSGYDRARREAFSQQLLDRLRVLPGVASAAHVWVPVLCGYEADWTVAVEGRRQDGDAQALVNLISPGYWQTLGISMLDGRDFDERDVDGRQAVAIVSRQFARWAFGDRRGVGRRIGLSDDPTVAPDIEIVGVVEDSLYEGPRQGMRRQVYFPARQSRLMVGTAFYLRTTRPTAEILAGVRHTVAGLDPSMPVFEVKTLADQLDETLGTERLSAAVTTAFGVIATLLAALGLNGVMLLMVERRTREIGVRLAIGARPPAVVWMIVAESGLLVARGVVLAIPLSYMLSRIVASQLYGTAGLDIWTGVLAATVLLLAATAASVWPAWRAATTDPMLALRHE